MEKPEIKHIRDEIVKTALMDIPFEGHWHWPAIEMAAQKCGHSPSTALAVFPEKVTDVLKHFSSLADSSMIKKSKNLDLEEMRIRDRVLEIGLLRFEYLNTYKEAERLALQYWLLPANKLHSLKILWNTCDRIWARTGDKSTDYNRHTKRGLLAGVMASTTLVWLNDESSDMIETRRFMERRIDNVLQIGKTIGPGLNKLMKVINR